jgi:hypothetical protein
VRAAAAVVAAVPPLAIGRVPVTPVVKGRPVPFVSVPEVGVPRTGVIRVGLVFITNVEPVPVWLATLVALPIEVIGPVKLALVVTLPAVKPAAVPVMFVPTKAEGVPRAGVTSVGLLLKTTDPVPVLLVTPVPPLATGSVPLTCVAIPILP